MGKTVVITGATGGIGYELCKELKKKEVKLVAVARSEEKLSNLSKTLGGNLVYIAYDFANSQNLEELDKLIRDKCERIDILINNAGVGIYKTIEESDLHDWTESVAINVTVPFFLIKALLPLLTKSEKALVMNVGSGMSKIPTAGRSLYCASKAALRLLSMSLSKEYEGTNIHFVHITLGSTLTKFGPMSLKEKEEEKEMGKWITQLLLKIRFQ